MSQLLQTAKMKLVIYGKLLLVLKQISFQWNAMLIQSVLSQATGSETKYSTENKFYTPYWFSFPTLFQKFTFLEILPTIHYHFPTTGGCFPPRNAILYLTECQHSISFDWCATPHCYSYYKHQPQFGFIPSLRNKAQAENSSDSRLYVIRDSRS